MERPSESVLREQIARELRGHRPGRGRRYPVALRERVVRYAEARRASGGSLVAIGRELGIPWQTVSSWCSTSCATSALRTPQTVSLVPVRVVSRVEEMAARSVAVTSPTGFRVDGLSLAEATAMLRALA